MKCSFYVDLIFYVFLIVNCLILLLVTSIQYSPVISFLPLSKPMYCLFVFKHAIIVLPEPKQLSNTVSPSLEYVRIKSSKNNIGF